IIEHIKTIEDYRLLSITDGLTGLYNHRYFMEQLQKEINRALRQAYAFSVIMLDIDEFKAYNDSYGHIEGNNVLKDLADIFRHNTRSTDIVSRFGGEEFAIIALGLKKGQVSVFVDKLLNTVSNHPFPNRKISLSGGVAFYQSDGNTAAQLLEKADRRLYKAKSMGRNRVAYS
ncbi:MAG: GGDEF domain-containing protein, partial [Deltaproteobacteria bacterium]|nr:GGDEF domain-containing protein [Deltaproteobacteria bacterium]